MNPAGLLILILLIFVVVGAPRRWATLGMVAGVLYLTQNQQLVIGGFNLFAFRFLELAGFFRVMSRREFSFASLNKVDRALLLFYSFLALVYSLRATDGQAFVIGMAVDAFLCYFTFRGLFHDVEDLQWFLRTFVFLLAPFALMVLIESLTQRNLFSFIGGGDVGGWERGDRFRSVGSFRSPTLLGTFGAAFLPLYIGMAWDKMERNRALFGVVFCAIIVWASNSGGPISSAAMAVAGWFFWRKRAEMRKVRQWMVACLVVLALVMKAPIWYLLDRISAVTGGDGYNRAYLIDVSVQHLDQWWFAGMPITGTKDWFPYFHNITGGADITNQFISFGLSSGIGAIILFIVILKRAFSFLGDALAKVRSASNETTGSEVLLWALGIVLCVHITSWFGITYYDQSYVIWFMQLAALSSLSVASITVARLGSSDTLENIASTVGPEWQFEPR